MKTAIIAGATGLVGSHLLKQLLNDQGFNKVIVFVRRSTGISNPKLTEHIINFDDPEKWKGQVKGDVLFSTLGTTIGQAGSKEAQRKVDYTYQYEIARIASDNQVPEYVLVSTPGASPKSWIFYTRIRGELDRDVKKLGFKRIIILKPSLLAGKRENRRAGEELYARVLNGLKWLPGARKYRPIHAEVVAVAMRNAVKNPIKKSFEEYALDEIFTLNA